eukprot:CAMPEP_0202688306 /NCGR_PEP_ID=MMETSP1385-20130828/3828_1 /ASSEMBLY_ACC=CAM_ASM_000861 /TAXON_ID=933848 /ORGANISM="Elphidium margaritaceum" /LENGTH=132 /DNA_ID=CAMNT_0049343243 /DNA_START=12 /DNA_END=410 /DNA_ORIENTATION=+
MASASTIPQANEEEVRQQLAVQQFSAAQRELQALASRLAEMEMQKTEMEQVLEILKSAPKNRRAWYSVDGVLVEMTAETVIPRLYEQSAHVSKSIDDLSKDVDNKKEILADFAIKEKLVVPVYKDQSKPDKK